MKMSEKSGRPECAAWVTPYLTVKDAVAAIDFYAARLRLQDADRDARPRR